MKGSVSFIALAVVLALIAVLVGCSSGTEISYNSSPENVVICIKETGSDQPVFELHGNGAVRVRRNPFENKVESGQLNQRQVRQVLNHVVNKLRIGNLQSSYPKEFIPGIEMYPNMDLVLEVNTDGFERRITFAYSNICDELKYFLEEGRIDRQAFEQLSRLKEVVEYLLEYKF